MTQRCRLIYGYLAHGVIPEAAVASFSQRKPMSGPLSYKNLFVNISSGYTVLSSKQYADMLPSFQRQSKLCDGTFALTPVKRACPSGTCIVKITRSQRRREKISQPRTTSCNWMLTCPIFPAMTFSFVSESPLDIFEPPSLIASPAAASFADRLGLYFSFQLPLKLDIPVFMDEPAL
jgi:hypothetical protein